jgi:hypothetical protein
MDEEARALAGARLRDAIYLSDMLLKIRRMRLRREHPSASEREIDALLNHELRARPPDGVGQPRALST